MEQDVINLVEEYVNAHKEESEKLLKTIGRIPAPTRNEDNRAAFIRDWLIAEGGSGTYIDTMKNVICPYGLEDHEKLVVFAAHTDIVFPDTDELPMVQDGRVLRCPGIGDDTSNLVNMLMSAKYILNHQLKMNVGILFVANSCEEGLGNLDGTKEVVKKYGERMRGFYSFDGYMSQCTMRGVGSHRYRITVKTKGGHSWIDYGIANAIVVAADLISELMKIDVPVDQKTTCNIGTIEGGTTVNSIPQECSILYEFRSISQKNLEYMEQEMNRVIRLMQSEEYNISVELLGIRPGNGDIDQSALESFTSKSVDIIRTFYEGEPDFMPQSTDSNIPFSIGILANTIGTIKGGLAHTRQEWIDLDSLPVGGKIALSCMLLYRTE
jgi:acetylornithine deacetylase/succinyl-diaminopimelate desuccinylase-like protein